MVKQKKQTKKAKRPNVAIFLIPDDLKKLLKRESYRSQRSRSDIVREALYVYFSMRQ